MINFITGSPNATEPALEASIRSCLGDSLDWNLTVLQGGKANLHHKYNQGAKQTNGGILAFIHNDVTMFANSETFRFCVAFLDNPTVGIVGAFGAKRLNAQGTWWGDADAKTVYGSCRGSVFGPLGLMNWPGPYAWFGRVLVVDGVFLMMRREVFDRLGGFDESVFSRPHFYDLDLSLRAHEAGLCNYAAPIPMLHNSTGHYDGEWEAERQVFLKKWGTKLPVALKEDA